MFNDSITVPVNGPWGNYSFIIWTNDSLNAINDTEQDVFIVYADLSSSFLNININGSFNDWTNSYINDETGDAVIVPAAWGWVQMNTSLNMSSASFWGERSISWAGQHVSSAGDVNADGYDDILISAPFDSGPFSNISQAER